MRHSQSYYFENACIIFIKLCAGYPHWGHCLLLAIDRTYLYKLFKRNIDACRRLI